MKTIGITGGIGSGKSVVCKIFKKLGVPIYNADLQAKRLLDEHESVREQVRSLFGESVLQGGKVDRKKLAAIVFPDEDKLKQLNTIIHPAVDKDFAEWRKAYEGQPYVIEEAAILIENGAYQDLDKIILVTAPPDLRIKRVMERDGMSEKEVLSRMDRQWADEEKIPYADEVIHNDGITPVLPEVLRIHESLQQ